MRRLSIVLLVLVLIGAVIAPVQAQTGTILDTAVATPDLSTLVAAVQAADPSIAAALAGPGPLTVFAPTNQAFADLIGTLGTTAEELLANTELLNAVLPYHVVSGSVPAATVLTLDGQSVETISGGSIAVSIVDGGVVLNEVVNVIATDITASNGIVHLIDAVLLPQAVVDQLAGMIEVTPEATEAPVVAGDAFVRVAHFAPDAPAVDVYVDGEVALSGLNYTDVSDFVTLPAGTYEFAVSAAGTSLAEAVIGPLSYDLTADTFSTIAAIGSLAANTLTVGAVDVDLSDIPEDQARVTVFHAIEGAPQVDVLVAGEELVSELGFPGTITYADGTINDGTFTVDVAAGTYPDLTVNTINDNAAILDLSGTTFEGGTAYLVAAVGTATSPAVVVNVTDADALETLRANNVALEPVAASTILDIAVGNPDLSILVAAVQAADPSIAAALAGPGPITVFAPTNAAFEALLAALGLTADQLLADTALLNTVLTYHVLEGSVPAEVVVTLDGQTAVTLQGEEISIAIVDGGVVLNGSVNVIATDIIASNGIVHVIDAVLLPPSVSAPAG